MELTPLALFVPLHICTLACFTLMLVRAKPALLLSSWVTWIVLACLNAYHLWGLNGAFITAASIALGVFLVPWIYRSTVRRMSPGQA
jgi:hypothetical protein